MSSIKSPHTTSRERIAASAAELLARQGFEATTMRQIGDAVGLDNSSLYRHFSSKADLLNAVVDQVADGILALARRHTPSLPVTLGFFEDLGVAVGLHLHDNPSSARIMMHWFMSAGEAAGSISVTAQDPKRPHGRLLEHFLNILEAGARNGALRRIAQPEGLVLMMGIVLFRPATRGLLFHSLEPNRSNSASRKVWERELRSALRGVFAP